jgi:hypothetical protein
MEIKGLTEFLAAVQKAIDADLTDTVTLPMGTYGSFIHEPSRGIVKDS